MSCLADRPSKCTEIRPLNLDLWRLLVIPMNRFLGKTKGKLDHLSIQRKQGNGVVGQEGSEDFRSWYTGKARQVNLYEFKASLG